MKNKDKDASREAQHANKHNQRAIQRRFIKVKINRVDGSGIDSNFDIVDDLVEAGVILDAADAISQRRSRNGKSVSACGKLNWHDARAR